MISETTNITANIFVEINQEVGEYKTTIDFLLLKPKLIKSWHVLL